MDNLSKCEMELLGVVTAFAQRISDGFESHILHHEPFVTQKVDFCMLRAIWYEQEVQ